MLLSKGIPALKAIRCLKQSNIQTLQPLRRSHDWNYRAPAAPAPKFIYIAAEAVQGFAWWWVMWHLYTEPGHVFGEFPYPDPKEWSDEELGVPPPE